jgi:hypothetical protein
MLATLRASGERSDYELRGAACNLETMDAFLKQMVMMNVIKLGTFNILFLSFFELEHRCFTSHVMEIVLPRDLVSPALPQVLMIKRYILYLTTQVLYALEGKK